MHYRKDILFLFFSFFSVYYFLQFLCLDIKICDQISHFDGNYKRVRYISFYLF